MYVLYTYFSFWQAVIIMLRLLATHVQFGVCSLYFDRGDIGMSELFKEASGSTISLGGIDNLGNTCFMNACLKCLRLSDLHLILSRHNECKYFTWFKVGLLLPYLI